MTSFTISRGQFRGMLLATAPHAGRETDDTPMLGRVRFVPTGTHLHAWCTDLITAAAYRTEIRDFADAGVDTFDLPIGAVRAALAVFKAPGGPLRMSWCDDDMRIEVTREHVTFTEVGEFVDGRKLAVQRVVPANDTDRYPDVPRYLVDALEGVPTTGQAYRVHAEHLARFVAIAAWQEKPVRLHGMDSPDQVLVRCGGTLLGSVPALPGNGTWKSDEHQLLSTWRGDLVPLRRPERIDVPEKVTDALREQAADIFRDKGITVTSTTDLDRLRVTIDLDDPDLDTDPAPDDYEQVDP